MADEPRKSGEDEQPQPMSQAEIDALFAELAKTDAAEAESAKVAEAASTRTQGKASAADGTQSDLRQTEIDHLLQAESPAAAVAPSPSEPAASGALGQDGIDAILAQMTGEKAQPEAPQPASAPQGALGQDDIDALLAQMGASEAAPPAPAAPAAEAKGALGQDDIDALLAQMGAGEPTALAPPAAPAEPAGGGLGQDDIDKLLAELGTENSAVTDGGETGSEPQTGSDSGRLTTEQIEAIVNKQGGASPATTPADTAAEAMISQSDIDALVRQMSMATAVVEEPDSEATLVNPQQDIDALLNQVRSTVDVSDPVQTLAAPMSMGLPADAALVAPDELRGTRWLLVAAVFLLTLCSATLTFIAQAINGLSAELHAGRTAQALPQDGYEKDVAVGRELLASEDPVNVVKGLQFFDRMKRIYPERRREIGMILADHHSSREAWQRAVDEYLAIHEQYGDFLDDPRIDLNHADALFRLGRVEQAMIVINRLLANEGRFARATDDQGRQRADAVVRAEREIVQRAYLLLGRLYTAQIERLPRPSGEVLL